MFFKSKLAQTSLRGAFKLFKGQYKSLKYKVYNSKNICQNRGRKTKATTFSIFLVILIIPIPVVNYSNIPKTCQDFVQNCIASFASSSTKQSFSNAFYPSGGGHVGDPEPYRILPVVLWREPSIKKGVN